MTKPVIVKREVKGTPLTYTELDTNFQNLKDATINFSGDLGDTRSMDLNDVTSITGNHNIKVTVDEATQSIVIDNQLHQYTREPMGFPNRADSTISFNTSTRVFTIAPVSGSFSFFVQGNQYIKTTAQTVTIPNVSDLYLIYFNTSGVLSYRTSAYDYSSDCMVSAIQWNATTGDYYFLGEERHGVTMDWATHEYLNGTQGLKYGSGFSAVNYTTVGSGALDADAQIDLTDGVMWQEDVKITVVHSNTPNYLLFEQDIAGPGRFPVTYQSGSADGWIKDSATNFPVKFMTTRIAYNLNTAGTWSAQEATNNHYVAMWLVGTSNLKDGPIVAVMGQREDSNISNARDNNVFSQLDLTNFAATEARPLYRLIFQTGNYGNAVNARLVDIGDVRREEVQAVLGSSTSGLANLLDDLSPQLGGNLDVNGFSIVSVSNGDITIVPNGTGTLYLRSGTGTGNIDLGNRTIVNGNDTGIRINPGSGALTFSNVSGGTGHITTADNTQALQLSTNNLSGGQILISSAANGNITVIPNGTGKITLAKDVVVTNGNISSGGIIGTPLTLSSTDIIEGTSQLTIDTTITLAPAVPNGVVYVNGPLTIASTVGTPTTFENGYYEDMLQTPVSWLQITVGGSIYYLPLFQ